VSEEFEEQKGEQADLGRYLDIVRRRHLYFLGPLLVGWALVWGSSWFLAPRYKSVTLILVQPPTMPRNYVVPNVSDDLQDRMESITQQILSRTRLLLIIENLHLYNRSRHYQTPDDKVTKMRKDIGIDLVRDPRDNTITAFKVSYSAPDPHTAQRVTSELTNLFINENLRVRQQESEDTTHFLQSQLDTARASLADQESRVRDFSRAHEGELPAQQPSNLQILSGLQTQLQSDEDALNAAVQQRVYSQTLIDQYRALQAAGKSVAGISGSGLTIDEQLTKMKSQLADLRAHYTEQYPDIQRLKRQIAETEKLRDSTVAAARGKAGAGGGAGLAESTPLLQLESQLKATEINIATREKSIAALKARIALYQNRLDAAPAMQQQLADLTRGYDQSKANYDDLLKKQQQSEMATSMEQMQQGERFTMLDPPSLPIKPDFPNRLKMCLAGIGVGAALGTLLVVVLEFLDDRLYGEKEIRNLLPMTVLSEIPEIMSESDERKMRRQVVVGWAAAALVLVILAGSMAFSYLRA
jgi:succinoglycan biosynthesis transport protein ExoP